MPRTKISIGSTFFLAFILAFTSSLVSAQEELGQPSKPKDGPSPSGAKSLPGMTVNGFFDRDAHYAGPGVLVLSSKGIRHVTDLPPMHVFASASRSPSTTNDPSGCPDKVGEPIEISSGTKLENIPVFALPGEMGLKYELYYNTAALNTTATDPGYMYWTSNLSYWLDTNCSVSATDNGRCNQTIAHLPDGSILTFSGGPTASAYQETFVNGLSISNPVAALSRDATTGNYTLRDENALTEVYSSSGQLLSITDLSGIGWTFSYTTGTNANTRITHTDGRSFTVAYTPKEETITDPEGNVYTLTANSSGDGGFTLTYPGTPATAITFKNISFSDPAQPSYYFTRLSQEEYNGVPYANTSYVTSNGVYAGWANGTSLADGTKEVSIAYGEDAAGNLSATITNPLGHVSVNTYDGTNGSNGPYNGQLSAVSNNLIPHLSHPVIRRG